jgi:hypothetical protein
MTELTPVTAAVYQTYTEAAELAHPAASLLSYIYGTLLTQTRTKTDLQDAMTEGFRLTRFAVAVAEAEAVANVTLKVWAQYERLGFSKAADLIMDEALDFRVKRSTDAVDVYLHAVEAEAWAKMARLIAGKVW